MRSSADGRGIPGRLRWRCRRGMLELDLELERFLQREAGALSAGELRAFECLLALDDAELWQRVRQQGGVAAAVQTMTGYSGNPQHAGQG